MIANPIRVPGVELPQRAAPRMGEHNEALLREAGFDDAAIAKLRELGVIDADAGDAAWRGTRRRACRRALKRTRAAGAIRCGSPAATLPVTPLVQAAASAATIAPTVAAPACSPHLGVGPVAVGFYIAIVYLARDGFQPMGRGLVRRWGPIRTSQVSLAFCAVGVLLVGVPHWRRGAAGAR